MSAAPDEAGGTRRVALTLASAVLLAVALLGGVRSLTAERAAEARAALLAERLGAVLHGVTFERVMPAVRVPSREGAPLLVHRVRQGGRTVAAVLNVVAPDGYSGAIELLVGVRANGRLSGVRVLSHRETPGLGDRIERRRSDWITGFDGRSLERGEWRLTRSGGEGTFDALSGATITSRAVVEAVRHALVRFAAHRETVLAP